MGHLKLFLCSLATRKLWVFVIRYPRNSWEDPLVEVMAPDGWLGRAGVAYRDLPEFIETTMKEG